jgi:hypothetical protein
MAAANAAPGHLDNLGREVCGTHGYLSQSERVQTFELGGVTRIDRVTIHWPGARAGPPTVLTDLEVDTEHHVAQGKKE